MKISYLFSVFGFRTLVHQFSVIRLLINRQLKDYLLTTDNRRPITEFGFTVIEIIVVFAVIAVLSTIGVASFVNYNRIQTLQTGAADFTSTLNLARSRALSQAKPPECASQVLNGYRVSISISGNSYILEAICSGFSYRIQSRNLPQNVIFQSSQPTSFFFPVIVGGVSGAGTVVLSSFGQTKSITVDSIGGIK